MKTYLRYASGSWTITQMTLSRLKVINRCLQRIIKTRDRPDRTSNKELSKKTGEEPCSAGAVKWNWFGQTIRSDDSVAKQALQWTPQGCAEEAEYPGTPGKKIRRKNMDSELQIQLLLICLLYTSPSPRDGLLSRMPSSA